MPQLICGARPPRFPFDYQIEFRQIQKRRMPDLSREQWLDLFAKWRERYAGKLEIKMTKLRKCKAEDACELAALVAERNRRNPAAKQFVCKCGEVIANPLDPEQMKIHQPHFIAASLPQVHAALERWRDYARRTIEAASDPGGEPN